MTSLEEYSAALQQHPELRLQMLQFMQTDAFRLVKRFVEATFAQKLAVRPPETNPAIMSSLAFEQAGAIKTFHLMEFATKERKKAEQEPEHFSHYGNQEENQQPTE